MPYFDPNDIPDIEELNSSLFFLSASSDDVDAFASLLDSGMDPNTPDEYGETPVTRAINENALGVVRLLLDRNVTLPHDAIATAVGRGHVDLVHELINRGYDVNTPDSLSHTPLMTAALMGQAAEAALLVDAGARVELTDSTGMTALHHAATSGSVQVIQILLTHGATRDVTDHLGHRPVDWALDNNHSEAASLLASEQTAV